MNVQTIEWQFWFISAFNDVYTNQLSFLKLFSVLEVQVNEFYNDLSIFIFGIFHIMSQISDVKWNMLGNLVGSNPQ